MEDIKIYKKGALLQDKAAHYTYDFSCDARNRFTKTGVQCCRCGSELEVYYDEERLYTVRCLRCKTAALTYAKDMIHAAEITLGGSK